MKINTDTNRTAALAAGLVLTIIMWFVPTAWQWLPGVSGLLCILLALIAQHVAFRKNDYN